MDIVQNSVFLFQLWSFNTPIEKMVWSKVKQSSAIFCPKESLFDNQIGLGKLGGPLGGRGPGSRSVVFACHYWLEPPAPGLLGGPLVYTGLFCYQIMTLIDKIVHSIFFVLIGPVLKLVYLKSEVEQKWHYSAWYPSWSFWPYCPIFSFHVWTGKTTPKRRVLIIFFFK